MNLNNDIKKLKSIKLENFTDGKVTKIKEDHGKYKISITNKLETKEHITNYGSKLCVENLVDNPTRCSSE